MLLKFNSIDCQIEPRRIANANLHLSGGLLLDYVSGVTVAQLVGGAWIHAGAAYSSVRFVGAARLLFGLPHHPWRLSEIIQTLTLKGPALLSGDTRVASFIASCDIWRAASRPIWWRSMHVLDAAGFGPEIETLPDLHLWALDSAGSTQHSGWGRPSN
jgi:hypothetical protein